MDKRRVGTYSAGVFAAGAIALAVSGCSSSGQPPVAEPTNSTPTSPSASTTGGSQLPPSAFGKPAQYGNGVTATLTKVERVNLTAKGPGEIAGPGVRVEVKITNASSDPIDIGNTVVNLAYGEARTPAEPTASQDVPFNTTNLAPGQSATAVYNFHVPSGANPVTITVSYAPEQPVAVFVGRP